MRAMTCGKTAAVRGETFEALCLRKFTLPVWRLRDLWRGQERLDKNDEGHTRKATQEASAVVPFPVPSRKGCSPLSASQPCQISDSMFPVSRSGRRVKPPYKRWHQLGCHFSGTMVLLRPLCRSGRWRMHQALWVWLCCVHARSTALSYHRKESRYDV